MPVPDMYGPVGVGACWVPMRLQGAAGRSGLHRMKRTKHLGAAHRYLALFGVIVICFVRVCLYNVDILNSEVTW